VLRYLLNRQGHFSSASASVLGRADVADAFAWLESPVVHTPQPLRVARRLQWRRKSRSGAFYHTYGKQEKGIAFLLQGKTSLVVGAGTDFGNGGDDFSWMDSWHVEDRGTKHGNYRGQSVSLQSDGLVVIAKEGSASALIYLRNGKPQWHQYGD